MHQPPLWHVVILNGTVLDRAVVPHQEVSSAPLVTINEGRFDDVIGKCGDQRLGFFLIHAIDTNAVVAHDVQAPPPGIGMGSDDRMPDRRVAIDLRLRERKGSLTATKIEDRVSTFDPISD